MRRRDIQAARKSGNKTITNRESFNGFSFFCLFEALLLLFHHYFFLSVQNKTKKNIKILFQNEFLCIHPHHSMCIFYQVSVLCETQSINSTTIFSSIHQCIAWKSENLIFSKSKFIFFSQHFCFTVIKIKVNFLEVFKGIFAVVILPFVRSISYVCPPFF